MKIAIIGSGNVGSALASAATSAGHQVTLAARNPDNAAKVAADTGAAAASSAAEAASGADVVVLAVPAAAAVEVAQQLSEAGDVRVLVDSTNPMNDTYSDLTTQGTSVAEQVAAAVPGTPVVKAFNTIFASRHASPSEGGQPLDAFLAGDDDGAKQATSELASSLGYRPIDAGGLRMARTLEEMALLNITLNAHNGWAWQSAYRLVGPTG